MPDPRSSEGLPRLHSSAPARAVDPDDAQGGVPGGVALAPPPALRAQPRVAPVGAPAPSPSRAAALGGALDLIVLAIATAPVLLLGAPALGYLVAAGAWCAQRILARYDTRLIGRAQEPGTRLGMGFVDAFGRIWLLAGAIVAAGVIGGRADGLTAALVIFVSYSLAFAVRLVAGISRGAQAR
jgi:hypothetical protein